MALLFIEIENITYNPGYCRGRGESDIHTLNRTAPSRRFLNHRHANQERGTSLLPSQVSCPSARRLWKKAEWFIICASNYTLLTRELGKNGKGKSSSSPRNPLRSMSASFSFSGPGHHRQEFCRSLWERRKRLENRYREITKYHSIIRPARKSTFQTKHGFEDAVQGWWEKSNGMVFRFITTNISQRSECPDTWVGG